MVSLRSLLEVNSGKAPTQRDVSAQPIAPAAPGEYNVGVDFTTFERKIAAYTENAKNQFQVKLLNLVGGKQVFLRGSKGYGQPIKDYTINVKTVSIDFYYERYVVVFKDDKDKEYFLEPGYKIKILGPAKATPKKEKSPFIQAKQNNIPLPSQNNINNRPK